MWADGALHDRLFGTDPEIAHNARRMAVLMCAGFATLELTMRLIPAIDARLWVYSVLLPATALGATPAIHDEGLLNSWVVTAGPVAGFVSARWVMTPETAVLVPDSFVYTAAHFWIGAILILGTIGYGFGRFIRHIDPNYGPEQPDT